jgi:CYTH domain-containing protein
MNKLEKRFMETFELKKVEEGKPELVFEQLMNQLLDGVRKFYNTHCDHNYEKIFYYVKNEGFVYEIEVDLEANKEGLIYRKLVDLKRLKANWDINNAIDYDTERLKYGIYLNELVEIEQEKEWEN